MPSSNGEYDTVRVHMVYAIESKWKQLFVTTNSCLVGMPIYFLYGSDRNGQRAKESTKAEKPMPHTRVIIRVTFGRWACGVSMTKCALLLSNDMRLIWMVVFQWCLDLYCTNISKMYSYGSVLKRIYQSTHWHTHTRVFGSGRFIVINVWRNLSIISIRWEWQRYATGKKTTKREKIAVQLPDSSVPPPSFATVLLQCYV